MKLILTMIISMALPVFAAEVTLDGGDTITIEANVKTTVTCSGDGQSSGDCAAAARGFRSQLEYCYKNQSGAYCQSQFWPKYKKNNPECIFAGMDACLEYCYKNQSGSYCANQCQ